MEEQNGTANGVKIKLEEEETNEDRRTSPDHQNDDDAGASQPLTGDGASPGKIFIGGLARETTSAQFVKHFGKYGEIIDSVIMKERRTGQPRGFGFVTYADPSVVDKVIEDDHVINGKQVEIKRTIPRGGGSSSKDFKTKKIFVGGIPTTISEDEFRDFFLKFGEVKEHQIMRDHSTSRSRGFGFITFDTEKSVEDILANGNRLDFAGTQVEIKKAEPKRPNAPQPAPFRRQSNPRAAFGGGFSDSYGGYGDSGYGAGAGPYRSGGPYGGRSSAFGGYSGAGMGGYGAAYGGSGAYGGGFREEASFGYSSRYGGGAFGRGYDVGGGGGYGGPGEGYGGYAAGSGGYGSGYGAAGGLGSSGYGGDGTGGSMYGSSRGSYGGAGSGRYHPYGR